MKSGHDSNATNDHDSKSNATNEAYVKSDHDSNSNATQETYVPGCATLDAHVRRIHQLAREGVIDAQTAERHLNAHLAAAGWIGPAQAPAPHWLVMPLADAPQFGNLPDLWPFVHRALACPDFRLEQGLQGLILQTLPCFRRPTASAAPAPTGTGRHGKARPARAEQAEDEPAGAPAPPDLDLLGQGNAPVLINLLLALLLGLYPDAAGKPQFGARARIFRSLHAALTGPPEAQELFVRARLTLVSLALMEYLARVMPACMPAEEEFLRQAFGMGPFFEQAPLLCNEFRSGLTGLTGASAAGGWDPLSAEEWAALDARAGETVERTARVKRRAQRPGEARRPADEAAPDWRAALDCPVVPGGSRDDYKILAHAFGLPRQGADAERVHSMIRVGRLPSNLRRLQEQALALQARDWRCAWLRSRLHVCPACLTRRGALRVKNEFRVDTLTGGLVCSAKGCRCADILTIDLLVRC